VSVAYPHIFQPLQLRGVVVSNRIVSTAHNPNWASDGLITDKLVRYYTRKAQGETGMVTCFGSADVYESAANMAASISLWNPANESALRQLADAIHRHGSVAISQATHLGHRGDSSLFGKPLESSSDVPQPIRQQIPHVLRQPEIRDIVGAFASAAQRLEKCGWDGIEITSYGGHLIEQFWSPIFNRRHDMYGGSLPNRMRFSVEILEAVAESVSENFVISFRMTGDPLTDDIGLSLDDFVDIASRLDAIGRIDIFHISGGTGATLESQSGLVPPDTFAEGCYLPAARRIRESVRVPVLATGRVLDPALAEAALADGDCDLVGMTRAIIADPDFVSRARTGTEHRIRPCIGINDGCIGRNFHGLPMSCSVNPSIAEPELEETSVRSPRRVVVVGGGPAGLEAARATAKAGHRVILLEKDATLGGQLGLAALTRPRFGRYIQWVTFELQTCEVDIKCGYTATADMVRQLSPDAVVLATGAFDSLPPGADRYLCKSVTDVDILRGLAEVPQGGHVAVYDVQGEGRGASIAIVASQRGAASVELITPLRIVCQHLDDIQWPGVRRRLSEYGVTVRTDCVLTSTEERVPAIRDIWSGGETVMRDLDLAIFVGYRHAQDQLEEAVSELMPHLSIYQIGDSVAPRNLQAAIAEGTRIAHSL
jgi:2,4-dienoyl-CoA reductase-like NADH-dependent reductase (Old Yellow Enzyme family)